MREMLTRRRILQILALTAGLVFSLLVAAVAIPEYRRHVVLMALLKEGNLPIENSAGNLGIESRLPDWITRNLPPSIKKTWFVRLNYVEFCDLSHLSRRVTNAERQCLEQFPELESITLRNTLTGGELRGLPYYPRLIFLDMDLTTTDGGVEHFRKSHQLHILRLAAKEFGKHEFEALAGCPYLGDVALKGDISMPDQEVFGKLSRLKHLILLNGNYGPDGDSPFVARQFSNASLRALSPLESLETLALEEVEAGSLAYLPVLRSLKILHLKGDVRFSELTELRRLANLEQVNIFSPALYTECKSQAKRPGEMLVRIDGGASATLTISMPGTAMRTAEVTVHNLRLSVFFMKD